MNSTSVIVSRPRAPWLDRLLAEPARAVDTLLRGVAHLPGLQRASPSEALMALLGDLPMDADEWKLLDRELLSWLKARRRASEELLLRPGGAARFIRETSEAFRAAWRLSLPESSNWVHSQVLDLLRWANNFSLDATFDLGKAILYAAANLQQGSEFRFLWLRICEEAAEPRLRQRLDASLLGLAKISNGTSGGPSHHLIIGLARWASQLPKNDNNKSEVVREWRALKAAFPRQPGFWRDQWEAIFSDDRISSHPFTNWLRESEPALQTSKSVRPRRSPVLPKDIKGTIHEMQNEYSVQGLTPALWQKMDALLAHLEHYADSTGESYYFVTSSVNIASIIMEQAPGHSLNLARRALLWSPSNGHAWSVRANALDHLGRVDLSEAVLWEALRRTPSNLALYVDLALILSEREEYSEAEILLRKAIAIDTNREDAPVISGLARILWLQGRADESLKLMHDLVEQVEDPLALRLYCRLLIAEGQGKKATEVLKKYIRFAGQDQIVEVLNRLIVAGKDGEEEMQDYLRNRNHFRLASNRPLLLIENTERTLALEENEYPRLEKISRVAKADLLFQLGDDCRDNALRLINEALADPSDAYAQVVKGLAVPEYRIEMIGRVGRFAGSLPVRLALTPDTVSEDYWRNLARHFPEGEYLVNLVQLARGEVNDELIASLAAWCDEPTRWDNGWDQYLKDTIRRKLNGAETSVDLSAIVHDALTQAVDVGMDALPLVA